MAASTTEKALRLLRELPRVSLSNLRDNPGARQPKKVNRGQRAIKPSRGGSYSRHGHGHKKLRQHGALPPLGYEGNVTPFYLRIPQEFYYRGFHLRRQYPPFSLFKLQRWIDQGRLDPNQPIDLAALCKAGFECRLDYNHYGVNLTDEGADFFEARVNIEVQWSSEAAIAGIERRGGTLTTAWFDMTSLWAIVDPQRWFQLGYPIPRRLLPPDDLVTYYSSANNRGYLAPLPLLAEARFATAQKYGYALPEESGNPASAEEEMLALRKHPGQVFYGLEPGWVVNLADRVILKPTDPVVVEYYGRRYTEEEEGLDRGGVTSTSGLG